MVQFFDPTQEAEIKRRRRMAEMLQKNSGPRQTEVVSGFAVPQSGLEQLARGLSGGLGAYEATRADVNEQELATQRQALLGQALASPSAKDAAGILVQDPSMAKEAFDIAYPRFGLGNTPAALQLANEEKRLLDAGDLEGARRVREYAKTADVQAMYGKGLTQGANGAFEAAPGYAAATGDIKRGETRGGAIGKAEGEAQGAIGTSQINAPKMQELISQAQTLLPEASSGLTGRIGAGIKGAVGYSDEATKADRQLEVISAALTGNVPRFEGPQGVLDVQLYKQAAGDVANRAIPREDRLAALKTIEQLNAKYLPGGAKGPAVSAPPAPGGAKFLGFE